MDFFKLSKIKRPENEMMKGAQMMVYVSCQYYCDRVNFYKILAGSLFMLLSI